MTDGRSVGRSRSRDIKNGAGCVRVVCSSLLKCRKDGGSAAQSKMGERLMENEHRGYQPTRDNEGAEGERRKRAKSRSFYARQGRNTVVRLLFHFKTLRGWHRFAHPSPTLSQPSTAHPPFPSSMRVKFALTELRRLLSSSSPPSPPFVVYVPFLSPFNSSLLRLTFVRGSSS